MQAGVLNGYDEIIDKWGVKLSGDLKQQLLLMLESLIEHAQAAESRC